MTTSATTHPGSLVHDLYHAISSGASGDALAAFFHPDAEQIEYPSMMRPHGHRRRLEEIRAGAELGARIIRDQHFEVHNLVAQGDRVAVQFTWTATVATDLGSIPAGTRLTSHVAAFYDIRDGLVLRQSSYDGSGPIDAVIGLIQRTYLVAGFTWIALLGLRMRATRTR